MRLITLHTLALIVALASLVSTGAASPFDITEHTPGHTLNAKGQRAWNNERYFDARHRFKQAAYWGDKLAQHNLGVMYYRGDGVEPEPARAWAWFALAAERGYPQFVEPWEALWHELDEQQQQRAREILAELEPRYSDRVAVPRTAERMRRERKRMTGSRTGFIGTLRIIDKSGFTRDGEDFYAAEKWDFRQIVQMETELFRALASGRVDIGNLELIDDEAEPERNEDETRPDPSDEDRN